MKFGEFMAVSTLSGLVALGVVGGAAKAKTHQLPLDQCGIFYRKNYPNLALH